MRLRQINFLRYQKFNFNDIKEIIAEALFINIHVPNVYNISSLIWNAMIIREVVPVRRRRERPITSIQFSILWKPYGSLLLQSWGSKTFRMLVMIFRPFFFCILSESLYTEKNRKGCPLFFWKSEQGESGWP